jgi:hypothetical protein
MFGRYWSVKRMSRAAEGHLQTASYILMAHPSTPDALDLSRRRHQVYGWASGYERQG